jgi:hypothetical protein
MSRLFDPRRKDGTFPFELTPRLKTDVRATWDKVCPGWRDRKPTVPPIQAKRKA